MADTLQLQVQKADVANIASNTLIAATDLLVTINDGGTNKPIVGQSSFIGMLLIPDLFTYAACTNPCATVGPGPGASVNYMY